MKLNKIFVFDAHQRNGSFQIQLFTECWLPSYLNRYCRHRVMASKQIFDLMIMKKKLNDWRSNLRNTDDNMVYYILWHRFSFTSTFIVRILYSIQEVPFYFVLLNFGFVCYALLSLSLPLTSSLSLKLDLSCSNQIATCSWKHTAPKAKKMDRERDELLEVLRRWLYCWTFWTEHLKILCTTTWSRRHYTVCDRHKYTTQSNFKCCKFSSHLPQFSLELCICEQRFECVCSTLQTTYTWNVGSLWNEAKKNILLH